MDYLKHCARSTARYRGGETQIGPGGLLTRVLSKVSLRRATAIRFSDGSKFNVKKQRTLNLRRLDRLLFVGSRNCSVMFGGSTNVR